MAASRRAHEARMTVVQTLPDSRATVENRAAEKARIKPTIATRNRTHTWESPMEKRGWAGRWVTTLALKEFPRFVEPGASIRLLFSVRGRRRSRFWGNARVLWCADYAPTPIRR